MKISKYGDYILINSDILQDVLDNPNNYSSLLISGKINCCETDCEESVSNFTLDISTLGWNIDLSNAVLSNSMLDKIFLKNIPTNLSSNILSTPIDLGYVADNCVSSPCTLQTFNGHFNPLFKTAIDNYFTSIGVVSNVIITLTGNVLSITNLPNNNFVFDYIEYGQADPFTIQEFSYTTSSTAKVFLAAGALFILPEFFNNLTTFIDGIYYFKLTYYKASNAGYREESNCSFIDINFKCSLAKLIKGITNDLKNTEPTVISAYLYHYALVNGSNCGCNCDELCEIFDTLNTILTTNNIQVEDCGCQ